jgi:ABC-2 type transport system permease protein
MNKTFAVAKWEFLEKIKTKAFVISMIVTPIIIIAFAILPTLLSTQEETSTKVIGIIESTNTYFPLIKERTASKKLENNLPRYVLINLNDPNKTNKELLSQADKEMFNNILNSCLLIKNALTDSVSIQLRSKNTVNFRDIRFFEQTFNKIRVGLKLQSVGIDTSLINYIESDIDITPIKISKEGKESESDFLIVFFSSFIFIILLMMMILSSGGMLIRSLLEEKSNRLIEILVSSCTPQQLLTGKILGLSALGLFQMAIWSLIGIALVGSATVPATVFEHLPLMLLYFLAGFIFYTALFVGFGSIVTTEQEAQQLTGYISMILILPIVFAVTAIQNPNSTIIHALSYFPLTTPSIMLLRLNVAPVPFYEIVTTMGILIISILITIYLTAKIFRVGILSYGKRPSLKELVNWFREK